MSLMRERGLQADIELRELSVPVEVGKPKKGIRVSATDFRRLDEEPRPFTENDAMGLMNGIAGHLLSAKVGELMLEERIASGEYGNLSKIKKTPERALNLVRSHMSEDYAFRKPRGGKGVKRMVDGTDVSAEFAEEYWLSEKSEINSFLDNVVAAEQWFIDEHYVPMVAKGDHPTYPYFLHTDPNANAKHEQLSINNIVLEMNNGEEHRMQIVGAIDVAVATGIDKYLVLDKKFGKKEPHIAQPIIYSLVVSELFGRRRRGPFRLREGMKLPEVDFRYVNFAIDEGTGQPQYRPTIANSHKDNPIGWVGTNFKRYVERLDEMKKRKNADKKSFVLPYVPSEKQKESLKRAINQPHLIYLAGD